MLNPPAGKGGAQASHILPQGGNQRECQQQDKRAHGATATHTAAMGGMLGICSRWARGGLSMREAGDYAGDAWSLLPRPLAPTMAPRSFARHVQAHRLQGCAACSNQYTPPVTCARRTLTCRAAS